MTTAVRARAEVAVPAARRLALSPALRRLITGLALALAAAAIFVQLSLIWVPDEVGLDFDPLRNAATSLLNGVSVYSDKFFVYPPTAALPMIPFTAGSAALAFRVWVMVGIGALIWSAALLAGLRASGTRLAFFAIAVVVLVGSAVATDSLLLGNMSPVLVPFAVYTLLSFERGNWTRGCVVLVISLLLKPLLAPLLLLPIVRRQWHALAWSAGPGTLALAVGCLTIPGASRLSNVAGFVLGGTNLHGKNAVNNLSLPGWGEYNHQPIPAALAALVIAAAGVYGVVQWVRRSTGGEGAAAIGTVVLLTVFLAGRISEVHFLLTIMAISALALMRPPNRQALWLAVPGFALLVLPHQYFAGLAHPGSPLQTCYVLAQVLLLAAGLRLALDRS